jgi:hypothetical protein
MATGEPSKPVEHPCSFMKSLGLKIGKDSQMPCPVTIASGASYGNFSLLFHVKYSLMNYVIAYLTGLLSVSMFNPDLLQK